MFNGCKSLVGENGTNYYEQHIIRDYARIDKHGQAGYFTYKKHIPKVDVNADGNIDIEDAVAIIAQVNGVKVL